jgi:hypothetical protein
MIGSLGDVACGVNEVDLDLRSMNIREKKK